MHVGDWWKLLEKEFAVLLAEDAAFKDDEQFKIISAAIAEGVQLSGNLWHPLKDHEHGKNIQRIMGKLTGLNSLPVIVRTDDAAYKRSIRLMAIYIEHLERYAEVHKSFNSFIKRISSIIIDLDEIAKQVVDNVAHLKQQLNEEQRLPEGEQKTEPSLLEVKIEVKPQEPKVVEQRSPQQIFAEIKRINESIDYYKGVLLILVHDAARVAEQLHAISATFWVKVFSFFNSKTPKQKKLEKIHADLQADEADASAKLKTSNIQREELCNAYFTRRDELRTLAGESCSIASITRQVAGWNQLDDASRDAVEKMLADVFGELQLSSYDNQAEIGEALARKIGQAMYDKAGFLGWRGGKGIYIETLGIAAQSFGRLVGAVVLSKDIFKDVVRKIGVVFDEPPSPKRVALLRV